MEPTAAAGIRPGKEGLNRRRILECALVLVDRHGLEALSMRRLAAELDATAMALYNHVPNKDAVLEGVTELALGEIDLETATTGDWAMGLKGGFHSFRRVLLRHPSLVTLLQSSAIMTPDAMRPIEVSLSRLREAGFEPEDALRAHWALVGYTLGHVTWQLTSPLMNEGESKEIALEHKRGLPREHFPALAEVMPYLEKCDMDGAFDFGLDALVSGLKDKLGAQTSR